MKRLRVYADTSVFGGCFDNEFKDASLKFFKAVAEGKFTLVVSAAIAEELNNAPDKVQSVLDNIPNDYFEYHEVTDAMESLRDAYIKAGILDKRSDADALHVASATILNADMIISWNFKHIVHFEKIRGFNAINQLHGYKSILIYSPMEVVVL